MGTKLLLPLALILMLTSCKVVFISGYDIIIDETATKIKRDFNVFFIKLQRTIKTLDNNTDQKFANFQDYYDNMEVDIKILEERAISLPKKSEEVKKEITNIKKLLLDFESTHKLSGFKDSQLDDHHDQLDNINIAINSLLLLEEKIKTTGK